MKTYKEMADSALKRISKYEEKKKKRSRIIKQTVIAVFSICIISLVAIVVFKPDKSGIRIIENEKNTSDISSATSDDKKEKMDFPGKPNKKTTKKSKGDKDKIKTTTSKEENTEISASTKSASDEPVFIMGENSDVDEVIYADEATKGGTDFAKPIEKGSIAITDDLKSVIEKHGTESTYAIMVSFESSLPDNYLDEILIDGLSATEVKNQADTLVSEGKNEDAKILYVKIKEAERNYYLNYTEKFKATFANNGMEIYVEERGTTVENMIFYTYATGDKINNFTCKPNEAFCFTLATKFK